MGHVTPKSFRMEYMDFFRKQHRADEEEFVFYSIPQFKLFGAVNPEKTEVRCNTGSTLVVTLSKQRSIGWKQPAADAHGRPLKMHWMRKSVKLEGNESEDEGKEVETTKKKIFNAFPEPTKGDERVELHDRGDDLDASFGGRSSSEDEEKVGPTKNLYELKPSDLRKIYMNQAPQCHDPDHFDD